MTSTPVILCLLALWFAPEVPAITGLQVSGPRLVWNYAPGGFPVVEHFEVRYDAGAWVNVGLPEDTATTEEGDYWVPLAALAGGPHTASVKSCIGTACSAEVSVEWSEGGQTCPAPGIEAWTACFYSPNFSTLLATRQDATLDFNWGAEPPMTGVPADRFSARWAGTFTFVAGEHEFTTVSDDGVRVLVDGAEVLANWTDHPPTTNQARVTMTAGDHLVIVEFYENTGGAALTVRWAPVGVPAVDCVVSAWSAWVTTATSVCDPATNTRTLTQMRTRTIMTPPSGGGAACPALSETRTVTEACVPALTAPAPSVYTLTTTCVGTCPASCLVQATAQPPDAAGGWQAQFQRDGATVEALDPSAAWTKWIYLPPATYVWTVEWTKTGVATPVRSAPTTAMCQ